MSSLLGSVSKSKPAAGGLGSFAAHPLKVAQPENRGIGEDQFLQPRLILSDFTERFDGGNRQSFKTAGCWEDLDVGVFHFGGVGSGLFLHGFGFFGLRL
jgi:hypothetical protein